MLRDDRSVTPPTEFFWYDYETGGTNPKVDRAVQFCGIRTNALLDEIGEPIQLYCRLSEDYLPDPGAFMIHGISPRRLRKEGVLESEFAERIHQELTKPGTCTIGFNAMHFDHEITRFLFYRNLRDPYAWHWRNGNSKLDIIDLCRAAYVLRPDDIQWPTTEDDRHSFSLQDLARANGLRRPSHDALEDVQSMLELARMLRTRKPKLFNYYLELRNKKIVKERVQEPFVWVSRSLGMRRNFFALMEPLCFLDGNVLIAYDLTVDPSTPMRCSEEVLHDEFLLSRSSPIYSIRMNASPFVVKECFSPDGTGKMLKNRITDWSSIHRHIQLLRSDKSFSDRIRRVYTQYPPKEDNLDVDQALYTGFIPDRDGYQLDQLLLEDPQCREAADMTFEDGRLPELIFRYRARNYPELLHPDEQHRWTTHCRTRHLTPDGDGQTALDRFDATLGDKRSRHPDKTDLLDDLEAYAQECRQVLTNKHVPGSQPDLW